MLEWLEMWWDSDVCDACDAPLHEGDTVAVENDELDEYVYCKECGADLLS